MAELNDTRQENFCLAYTGEYNGNGTKSAIAAGYSDNVNAAAVQASRLLKNAKIVSRIREIRAEALRSSGYDKEQVRSLIMRRLTSIVSTNITDVLHVSPNASDPNREEVLKAIADINGGQNFLDFGEILIAPTTHMTEETASAVKSIKTKQATEYAAPSIDVDMYDVISAAKLLAEIAGIKEADTSVTINIDAASIVAEAERRQAQVYPYEQQEGQEQEREQAQEQEREREQEQEQARELPYTQKEQEAQEHGLEYGFK